MRARSLKVAGGNDGPMKSKHRFPQSLENAHAFPTFPPPDDDHTYSKREKIIVPERVKYLTPITPAFYLIDAQPLPVCHPLRHGRVRLLREDGAYWGKTSKGWFFGFKLHVLRHMDGRIVNLILTPGHWDDRAPVSALLDGVEGGVTLGNLGYRGKQRAEEWAEEAGLLVLTRADAPEKKCLLAQVR